MANAISDIRSERRFALVTGASSGIGLELAKQFAKEGFDLLITSGSERIEETRKELEALGVGVESVQADLATFAGVEAVYQRALSISRPLDAVAINAGVGVGGPFLETDLKAELNLVQLNIASAVHLAKRVLPNMVKRGEGRILFTSSIAATMPGPFEAVYAASKSFLSSFGLALRNELKKTGVTVTLLMPGPTETEFFHRAGLDDTQVGESKKDDPAQVAKQGYEALMAGEEKVVSGSFKNKAQAAAAAILPDSVKAQQHRKMSEPKSTRS